MARPVVTIVVLDRRFQGLKKTVQAAAQKIISLTKSRGGCVEIYLVSNRFMNKNVLAFPAPKNFPRPDIRARFLGEIYLNPDYIKKEKLGIASQKLVYMLIHGFLHLLGYDHKKKTDRIKMEREEAKLLKI